MHYGQMLQSHALHFFYLSSPDLLFGFDSDVAQRNIVGVAAAHPGDRASSGVLLRKFGQEVIRITAGKRVHGTGSIPGGMNKAVTVEERDMLLADINQIVGWSRDAVQLIKQLHAQNPALYNSFGVCRSNTMSLVGADGDWISTTAACARATRNGGILFDGVDYRDYPQHIQEEVKPWSYMKFPFLAAFGKQQRLVPAWGRWRGCRTAIVIPTPLAEVERREFADYCGGLPTHAPLAYHWARMIEMLHAAETIKDLLHDDDILGNDLVRSGKRAAEGIGVIEAPRGTLIHHYRVDEDDLVTMRNLIVSTTHNNQAMNEAIRAGRRALPARARDHRRAAEPHRGRDPLLRSLPVVRDARARADAARARTARRRRQAGPRSRAQRRRRVRLFGGLMQPGVVVLAAGNRSRGDDAIGPLLLERLASWLAAEGRERRIRADRRLSVADRACTRSAGQAACACSSTPDGARRRRSRFMPLLRQRPRRGAVRTRCRRRRCWRVIPANRARRSAAVIRAVRARRALRTRRGPESRGRAACGGGLAAAAAAMRAARRRTLAHIAYGAGR